MKEEIIFEFPDGQRVSVNSRKMIFAPSTTELINWSGIYYVVDRVEYEFNNEQFVDHVVYLRHL